MGSDKHICNIASHSSVVRELAATSSVADAMSHTLDDGVAAIACSADRRVARTSFKNSNESAEHKSETFSAVSVINPLAFLAASGR